MSEMVARCGWQKRTGGLGRHVIASLTIPKM